jgi:hypothetical protein
MARIVTSTVGSSNQYNAWIDAEQVSQNWGNNSSYIVVRSYVKRNDGYAASAYNLNGNVYRMHQYDWGNESGYKGNVDTRNSATVLLKETYYTVYHGGDGKKSVYLSAHCGQVSSSLPAWTIGGYFNLTDIPKQANLTGADNFNDEQNPTIYYNNPAGNSVTELVACIAVVGNLGVADIDYRAVSKTSGSYTFNLTEAERNVIRSNCANANSKTVRFYLRTLIGGQYYYSTLDRTASIINAAPTITGSYKDTDPVIVGVTGNNQLLISGLSDIEFTAVPTTNKYATISSVKIAGTTVSTPYKRTINNMTAASVLLEVTDSRGLTASRTINLSYTTYSPIRFMASFFRTAQMNNEIALQYSGTFHNTTIGSTTNTLAIKYRYQPELGEWSEWITTIPTVVGNNFSNPDIQILLTGSFDHNKQYRFEIVFEDALDTKTNTIIVRAGRHILKVTENVQVLQGKLHIQKLYTKEDKDFVFDFVYDVITRVWVVHVYGLTQLFEPQHVFQSDVNTRSIITVLNTEGYPLLKYTINDTSDNFIDYVNVDEPAHYNNYTLLDTGISPLDNVLDKRAREFQFTTFSDSAETLEFFVSAYIDSRNVSNPDQNTIDWISDPEDPNYGQLYEIEEEIANVYGETNLDSWVIDYSNFPKIGLVKSHLRLHGKGLFYRAIIVNRDMIEHELSGVTWVYRIMNAR